MRYSIVSVKYQSAILVFLFYPIQILHRALQFIKYLYTLYYRFSLPRQQFHFLVDFSSFTTTSVLNYTDQKNLLICMHVWWWIDIFTSNISSHLGMYRSIWLAGWLTGWALASLVCYITRVSLLCTCYTLMYTSKHSYTYTHTHMHTFI